MRRSPLALSFSITALLALAAPAVALTGSGTWNHLGTNGAAGPSLNGVVNEMYAAPDGFLYVGGAFKNAGGIAAADLIAKFDGKNWSSIGTSPLSTTGAVFAIAVSGSKVYAGGNFVDAGGNNAADYLAVYDGVSWKPFCNATPSAAFNLQVTALQVVGTRLYVGGTFYNANANPDADGLIACDLATGVMTTVFSPAPSSIVVSDLATDGTRLYAGGNFADLGGDLTADRVAWYEAGAWHGLSSTAIGGIVRSLHTKGTDVYIGADGQNLAGDAKADFFIKWNGSTYSAVGSNAADTNGYFPAGANIYEITSSGSLLFAAGTWQNADGAPTGDVIAYFDGTAWRPVGSNGAGNGPWSGDTQALAVFGGQLYAGGAISNGGGDPLANFAASRSLRLPDMFLDTAIGNNVYSPTAVGEVRNVNVPKGTQKTAGIWIQNDGLLPATFKLKGTGTASGYTIKYIDHLNGDADVTAAMKAGTYSVPYLLAPGQTYTLRMVIKLSASAANSGSFTVTATSTTNTPKDAVRLVVHGT